MLSSKGFFNCKALHFNGENSCLMLDDGCD